MLIGLKSVSVKAGQVAPSSVKRALTRLNEASLVRYRLDPIMGAGYWTPTQAAFDALSVPRAEFDNLV